MEVSRGERARAPGASQRFLADRYQVVLIGGGAAGLGGRAAANAFKVDVGVGRLVNLLLTKCVAGWGQNATEALQIAPRKVFSEIISAHFRLASDSRKYK